MRSATARLGIGLSVTAAAALAMAPGCTYLRHRADDAKETLDLGVTWSESPYLSANLCLLGLASVGGGKVDGQFAGLGGGGAGTMRHYHRNIGLLLWSYDEVAWRQFDPAKPETLERYHIGPIGWALYPQRRPPYAFG